MAEREATLRFIQELIDKHSRKDLQTKLYAYIFRLDNGKLSLRELGLLLERTQYQYLMELGKFK